MNDNVILKINKISKSFNNVAALTDINLEIHEGEVHALVGENGAGKSTLMKIINGIYEKDNGEMLLYGKPYHVKEPKEAISKGIAMIHQELNPILDMKVYENIFLGRESKRSIFVNKKDMIKKTYILLKKMNIPISPNEYMRNLSVAQMQLVEIVKAISFGAKIIIMDEPTSAITDVEAEILFKQIKELKKNGTSIIYISHKMDEIFEIADRISILRDGSYIGTYKASEIDQDKLIYLMVNRKLEDIFPKRSSKIGDVILKAENISAMNKIKNISFSLRKGEILGLAGLVGAGRSELVETLFGLHKKENGNLVVYNKKTDIKSPKDAIRSKIALITEDRKQTGLNLIGNVIQNITIVSIKDFARYCIIDSEKEIKKANEYVEFLSIKTNDLKTPVISLSGGNQQKIVIAKWLLNDPDIIIFDEPTRGIDIGAKREIYNIINDLSEQGKSVIMISSEMPELIGMSDRIIIMSEGKLTGEISREDFSQELIMKYASM